MSVTATQGTSGSDTSYQSQQSTTPPASTTDVSKNMFLQLLVAQLKNQDPLQPTDSTAFVGQLAQFQQLETSLNSQQDIAAMRQDLDQIAESQTTKTSS